MRSKIIDQVVYSRKNVAAIKIMNGRFQTALLFVLLAVSAVGSFAAGADGIDPNFNLQIQTNSFSNKQVYSMLTLPDDKMLAAGNFNSFNRQSVSGLIRLTADGLLDSTFNNNLLAAGSFPNRLYLLPDGKILISGLSLKLEGSSAAPTQLLRLNADGTLDSTFKPFGVTGDAIYSVAAGTDGKILVAGAFPFTANGVSGYKLLIRLNADGTIDNSFNYTGKSSVSIVTLQNNKPLVVVNDSALGQDVVSRLNADGSVDASFMLILTNRYALRVVKVAADNKILALTEQSLRRFNEDGSPDNGFQTTSTLGWSALGLHVGSDGKITYAIRSTTSQRTETRRILTDGTPDPAFTTFVFTTFGFSAFTVQTDNEIFIGDQTITLTGTQIVNQYTHLFASGAADAGFNPGGIGFQLVNPGNIKAIVVQPDQKIVMGGKFDVINDANRNKLARLNADNTIDNSFQINTSATGNYFSRINDVYTLALQANGKIMVTGDFTYLLNGVSKSGVVRLNADGGIDATFNLGVFINDYYGSTGGGKNKPATQSDGKIFIATSRGSSNDATPAPLRFNADGSRDATFNPTLFNASGAFIYDVAVQPNQKILISGVNLAGNSRTSFLIRLNGDGSVDQSFVKNEQPEKVIAAFNLLPDGKILIARGSFPYYSSSQVSVSRLNSDGTLDVSYVGGAGAGGYVNQMLPLPNGQTLIGGKFTNFNGQPRQNLALLNANGSVAATTYNVNQEVMSLAVDASNRILVGGSFTTININNGQNYARSYVARLNVSPQAGRTRFDFDGDGQADLATLTASNGIWSILNSQNTQTTNTQFGANGDRYAPADYDSDGKTDIAVFRPSNGTWYLMQSTAGFTAIQWGTAGDIPITGDFDGDGKAEIAVWRPSNGVWYILRRVTDTTLSFTFFQFGTNGDIPLSADFDGDGKTDIAVFRQSNGTFYWAASGTNNLFKSAQFGANGDIPAVGDYNGDGKADLVVWRPTNGVWYQYLSTASDNFTFAAAQFGSNGDVPVAADYDGDGKYDFAVRRGTVWYLLRSTQGFSAITFSSFGSQPVAATQFQPKSS